MQVDLQCCRCSRQLTKAPHQALALVLERIAEEGPWSAVGDGETLEDRVYTALDPDDRIFCPECAGPMTLTESSLAQFARELLAKW